MKILGAESKDTKDATKLQQRLAEEVKQQSGTAVGN
jgi:hypothetical protein